MKGLKNKVFIIEDQLDILYTYKTALKAAGISVEDIVTGREALEKIKEIQEDKREKPALVLLDLVLLDVNGLEILYTLRKNNKTKDIPVFILSNYSSDALHNMSYIKADKILLKVNTTPSELVKLVKQQIKV